MEKRACLSNVSIYVFVFLLFLPPIAMADNTVPSVDKIFQMSVVDSEPNENGLLPEIAEQDGADASDPTARVNFVDFRYRWLELTGNHERSWYSIETSMMLTHSFKLVAEVHYWDTDLSGRSESDFETLRLRGILLSDPVTIGNVNARLAGGLEWIYNLGDYDKKTSEGADQIAPLLGAAWLLGQQDTLITLIQHFNSYDTESGAPDIERTGPRIIYLHKFPKQVWLKADYRMLIDHENSDRVSNTIEGQLGKMLTKDLGIYWDVLFATDEPKAYNWGTGIGLRYMF